MKVAIIGAGNMGGAIARGLAKGHYIKANEITVSNPSNGKLEALKTEFPDIHTTHSNKEAVSDADIVIVAVKPWKMEGSRTHFREPGSLCGLRNDYFPCHPQYSHLDWSQHDTYSCP